MHAWLDGWMYQRGGPQGSPNPQEAANSSNRYSAGHTVHKESRPPQRAHVMMSRVGLQPWHDARCAREVHEVHFLQATACADS